MIVPKQTACSFSLYSLENSPIMEQDTLLEKPAAPKSWIQKLKEESWNAELLVTTISIFGALQLFDLVAWLANFFIDNLDSSQYLVAYGIVYFSLLAVSIMMSMFVIHFILRAYWVGLLGLNSVFPDYSIENSAYSPLYTKKLLATLPKLKDSIKKVDELCSVIFSVAFTFLLLYLYLGIFNTIYLLLFNLLVDYVPSYILLIPMYFIAGLMIVQTLLVLLGSKGKNRENEHLQSWTVRLVRFVAVILYGPFHKAITQVMMIFGSNYKKKKNLVYLVILFLTSGIFLSVFKMFDTNIPFLINQKQVFDVTKSQAAFYASEDVAVDFLLYPEIESDVIHSDVVRLFIPIYEHEKKLRKGVCEAILETKSETRDTKVAALLECYSQYNYVSINDGESLELDFLGRYHTKTEQFGIITYIPLTDIERGMHKIKVRKYYGEEQDAVEWIVPFYYAPKVGQ